MYLIVGLGNPGEEYEHTRHNAGFDALDVLAEQAGARYWKTECGSLAAKGVLCEKDVVLAKPQGFMNTSGGPVKLLCNAYGVAPDHVIVIHDDLDIDPGKLRVKFGGGNAGHNGLKSITAKLGTPDYFRVRCGIGRPPGRMSSVDYVLTRPCGEDLEAFEHACALAADAVPYLIEHGLEPTQNRFN